MASATSFLSSLSSAPPLGAIEPGLLVVTRGEDGCPQDSQSVFDKYPRYGYYVYIVNAE